jgi:hypothetical protein
MTSEQKAICECLGCAASGCSHLAGYAAGFSVASQEPLVLKGQAANPLEADPGCYNSPP